MTNRRDFLKAVTAVFPVVAAGLVLGQASGHASDTQFVNPLVVSTWDSGIRANAGQEKVSRKRKIV